MMSNAIANVVGGYLYDAYGGRVLFRASGLVAGGWCVLMCLYYGVRYKQGKLVRVEIQEEKQEPVGAVDNKSYEM